MHPNTLIGMAYDWSTSTVLLLLLSVTFHSSFCYAGLSSSIKTTIDLQDRDVKSLPLRIMPLGASITAGYCSTDHNGYRGWLREQLCSEGWEVTMVGSNRNGTMQNNENEGHSGFRVDQVSIAVDKSLHLQPNLVLINAGTNDALQNYHVDTAGDRMSALMTKLFDAIPGTTIILSTLLPNTHQQLRVDSINRQYRSLAARRTARGDRVILAEMSTSIKADQLVDGTHPTDVGYKEVASVWWTAITAAQLAGMIQRPNGVLAAPSQTGTSKQILDPNVPSPNLPRYSPVALHMTNDGTGIYGRNRYLFALAVVLQVVIRTE